MNGMNIEFAWFEQGGYSVYVNDQVVFECMSESEVKELTVAEIIKYYEIAYIG